MTNKKWKVLAIIVEMLVGVIICVIFATIFGLIFNNMEGATLITTKLAELAGAILGILFSNALGLRVTFKDKVKK